MVQQPQPWNESPSVDAAVDALLQRFSLDQKIALVSGKIASSDDPWSTLPPPAPIPPFSLSDGPAGVRIPNRAISQPNTTALPAPIALAATWSMELAQRYGDIIGAEARANGRNILLGPAVDIARTPLAGRTFESYGEDPLLQARMVVPVIQAIQAHAVHACLKHYIVNNQEHQRGTIDVHVDQRTLQEIYLPPFAAAIQIGHVAALMGSYNKINGTYACENPHILTALLREQFGFRGYVISDFMATQSTIASAIAGLDWELTMFGRWGAQLLAAVQTGAVPIATIDEMVRRILRPTIGLGLLEYSLAASPAAILEHGAQAQAIAEQGIVLLKNTGGLLPFMSNTLRSIAVIGPDADTVAAAGGGSALVPPAYAVSVLDGLRLRAGAAVRVEYAAGVDPIGAGVLLPGPPAVPSGVLTPAGGTVGEYGLRTEYWANASFAGEPVLVRTEPQVQLNRGFFDVGPGMSAASPKFPKLPPNLPGRMSIRWTGNLSIPLSGDYVLSLTSLGTARLLLDGQVRIAITAGTAPATQGPIIGMAICAVQVVTTTIHLTAGATHAISIEYAADAPEQSFFNEAIISFGWQPPGQVITPMIAHAVELAQQADVAVVVVRTFESEEMDRPNLGLPGGQDDLIRAVAAANPRTVVVLMTGSAVETASWETGVPALLEAWYAGQEQGNAVARVLFGDVNPAGKLPLTFPCADDQTPLSTPAQYPGIAGAVHYSEGLFVGYRGYDQLGLVPQYPFGHGLSYTTFVYTDVQVTPAQTNGTQPFEVQFTIENTGSLAGTELAQVYLGLPAATGEPPKRLAGWARVYLEPGQRQVVTVIIDPQAIDRPLSCWDVATHAWAIADGPIQVFVGTSSRDLPLTTMVQLS